MASRRDRMAIVVRVDHAGVDLILSRKRSCRC